uniref:G_PROTEIN_RECEP_F1_2 domain-containing protein n=1 Tax=Angiostrongylus cantonensis TaxID=6313 RepID=A0A0K0DLR9_ANGCA
MGERSQEDTAFEEVFNRVDPPYRVHPGLSITYELKEKNLRQNSSGILVLFLTTTDFLHAVTTYLDLSPYYIIISSIPLIAQLKINLSLTISIAVERALVSRLLKRAIHACEIIQALFLPIIFRKLCSRPYVMFSLFAGFLLAVVDVVAELLLSPFNSVPNCAAIGCFLSDSFRYYWGISNMLMGIVVIVLMTSILTKLRALRQKPHPHGTVRSKENRFRQANRSSVGILLISLVFVTLPSVATGLVEITGFSIFTVVGPFYIIGLLCCGACNSITYLALSKEMQLAAKKCLAGRRFSTATTVSTIKAFSTGGR